MKTLRSDYRERVRRRNEKIVAEWTELSSDPENLRGKVLDRLAKKYDKHPITIYKIIKQYGGSTEQ